MDFDTVYYVDWVFQMIILQFTTAPTSDTMYSLKALKKHRIISVL